MARRQHLHVHILPNTWLGRLLAIAVAAALLILAFFFLTFVLVATALLVLAAVVRVLLPTHKLRGQAPDGPIEGEYSIEREEQKSIDSAKDITPKR